MANNVSYFKELIASSEKYSVSDNLVVTKADGGEVSNFIVAIEKVFDTLMFDSSTNAWNKEGLSLKLHAIRMQGDKQVVSESIILRLSDIANFDWQQSVDAGLICHSGKNMTDLIRRLIVHLIPVKQYYLRRLGWFCIGEEHFYCAGNEVIGDNSSNYEFYIDSKLSDYVLIHDNCEIQRIADYLNNLFSANIRATPIIFSYLILGTLRQIFMDAGVPIKHILYLYGEHQSFKTTFASYIGAIYRRDDVEFFMHQISTISDAKLHEVLDVEKDCLVLIDDLGCDDNSSNRNRNEGLTARLIRSAANNAGADNMRAKTTVNGQLVITSEYLLRTQSLNNRLVALKLRKEDVDLSKLSYIESANNYDIISSFVYNFINYVADNYEQIRQNIYFSYTFFNRNIKDDGRQLRLMRAYMLHQIAFSVFMDYCDEASIELDLTQKEFDSILQLSLEAQIEECKLEDDMEHNILVRFYVFLRQNYIDSGKYCTQKIDFKNRHMLLQDDGTACLKKEIMDDFALENDCKRKDIVSSLQIAGLLITDKNKGGTFLTKVKNDRCYKINYALLKDLAYDLYKKYC